jgi:hypothetical protein
MKAVVRRVTISVLLVPVGVLTLAKLMAVGRE